VVANMSPRDLKPGQWVDGFRIIQRIGQGYFGLVFEAEKGGQRFALKFASHREGSGDAAQTDTRIERELICLHQLRHRHIVRIWGSGHWPDPRTGYRYIVLDLIEGYTLEQWAERTHPTPREVVMLLDKVFAAMEHMHGRNVFHRDLNLRNIMVSRSGNEPVLIDFSVGDYAAAATLTNEALPPGTPRYRSPEAVLFWEQHRHTPGARYAFKEADEIYALGAVLYDMLTHIKPSEAHKSEPTNNPFIMPASPFEVTQGRVPQALSDLTMNLMAREPGERPAYARAVRRVLADLKEHAGPAWQTPFHPAAAQLPPATSSAARVRAALTRVAPSLGEHGWRPWLALGGGLVLAAFLGILSVSLQPPEAAKQTNLSAGLPSSSPTQKETSPAVNPPENALPPAVPPTPQTRKAGAPRALSLAEKCTLAIAMASWIKLGCAGVQPRPEPGDCPKESIAGMRSLGWAPSDQGSIFIVMDVNQPPPEDSHETGPSRDGVYRDGPITGELAESRKPMAPKGMKLTGHLWTSGERIFGHYLWAHVPGKGKIPICLELGDSIDVGIAKQEGSKPGAVIARRLVNAYPTREWR
jgi:serine/threonine protein kinase